MSWTTCRQAGCCQELPTAVSTNWTYEVDSRGQVLSGQKRVGTSSAGTIFKGWDAAYAYDDIGNRTESRFGGLGGIGDPVGSETITYTANALNQYEEIANPRAAYVMGTAAYSATDPSLHTEVVINGQTADRIGVNFVEKLSPSGTGPKWEPLNFELVRDSVTQSFQQHLYVPPVQETLTYDLDGNLTGDGRWTYAWDGENRLVGMTTQAVAETAGVPGLKLTFAYDGLSRRVQKKVEGRTTSSDPWVLRSDTRFVYDGWNMVGEAEYLATAADAPPTFGGGTAGPHWRRTYVWGEDLSGSLQGAGGVGGLLVINRHERGSKPFRTSWATCDLNGNIIGLVESSLKAVYEYDPFGKPLRVSEPEEDLNPFRFSAKYTDTETGLCYYGYRYYDAVRGRWINRDPIEEQGGFNLYAFCFNASLSWIDRLGNAPMTSLQNPEAPAIIANMEVAMGGTAVSTDGIGKAVSVVTTLQTIDALEALNKKQKKPSPSPAPAPQPSPPKPGPKPPKPDEPDDEQLNRMRVQLQTGSKTPWSDIATAPANRGVTAVQVEAKMLVMNMLHGTIEGFPNACSPKLKSATIHMSQTLRRIVGSGGTSLGGNVARETFCCPDRTNWRIDVENLKGHNLRFNF